MTSIRGAITAQKNTKESIGEATRQLLEAVMTVNGLEPEQVVDILFTATSDLNAVYPAAFARELGLTEAGLMCMQEMSVEGSLRRCIRLLMHVEQSSKKQGDMRHVFLRDAAVLRPDLASFAVAIDGPSGAGKSTVAKQAAIALGLAYVDTGAMYRAIALYNIQRGTDVKDRPAVERSLRQIDISVRPSENGQRLLLNGEDVTEALRTQPIAEGSSVVAAYEAVRHKLLTLQRTLALTGRVVMDGRDIGSQVLPWAQVKIYLDASLEARIERRVRELTEKGLTPDPAVVRQEIEIRDDRDLHRAFSPLTRAADAVYIDSSDLSLEDTVEKVTALIKSSDGYQKCVIRN